jgi:hypothetical protein
MSWLNNFLGTIETKTTLLNLIELIDYIDEVPLQKGFWRESGNTTTILSYRPQLLRGAVNPQVITDIKKLDHVTICSIIKNVASSLPQIKEWSTFLDCIDEIIKLSESVSKMNKAQGQQLYNEQVSIMKKTSKERMQFLQKIVNHLNKLSNEKTFNLSTEALAKVSLTLFPIKVDRDINLITRYTKSIEEIIKRPSIITNIKYDPTFDPSDNESPIAQPQPIPIPSPIIDEIIIVQENDELVTKSKAVVQTTTIITPKPDLMDLMTKEVQLLKVSPHGEKKVHPPTYPLPEVKKVKVIILNEDAQVESVEKKVKDSDEKEDKPKKEEKKEDKPKKEEKKEDKKEEKEKKEDKDDKHKKDEKKDEKKEEPKKEDKKEDKPKKEEKKEEPKKEEPKKGSQIKKNESPRKEEKKEEPKKGSQIKKNESPRKEDKEEKKRDIPTEVTDQSTSKSNAEGAVKKLIQKYGGRQSQSSSPIITSGSTGDVVKKRNSLQMIQSAVVDNVQKVSTAFDEFKSTRQKKQEFPMKYPIIYQRLVNAERKLEELEYKFKLSNGGSSISSENNNEELRPNNDPISSAVKDMFGGSDNWNREQKRLSRHINK